MVFLVVSACWDTDQAVVFLVVSVSNWDTAQTMVLLVVSVCWDTAQAMVFLVVSACWDTDQAMVFFVSVLGDSASRGVLCQCVGTQPKLWCSLSVC